MKKILCIAFMAAVIIISGAIIAGAQMYGQQPGQYQSGYGQPQYQQPRYQQPAAQPQYGQQPSVSQQLDLPRAPQKPAPNSQYGNTDRAAILGEQFTKSSQGNANVYVSENPDKTISVNVKLASAASPYEIASSMANLTYMVDGIYYMTERKGNDVLLKVTDPSGNVITDARFSDAKNAFEYYNVPEAARQPTAQQPAAPAYGEQPGYGQQPYAGQMPAYGQRPGYGSQPYTGIQ